MTPGRRLGARAALLLLVAAACSAPSVPIDDVPPLAEITAPAMRSLLAESGQLLREAAAIFGDEVRFIGVAVKDRQNDARSFIAEFGLTGLEHYLDPDQSVPADLAGFGMPQTYFFAPGGGLVHRHTGVIDERTLALYVDDLRRLGG